MTAIAPKISVFPKCWFDDFCSGERDYVQWIHQAKELGGEGVEHYDGFFKSLEEKDVGPVADAVRETGQESSLICFSPNFTAHDPEERAREVDRQKTAIDLAVRMGTRFCRTLSGQAYPDLAREEGIDRTVAGIEASLEYAELQGVTLCMENHYKDGNWDWPEFAQPEDIFLEIIERIDSPMFGVQFDPSNCVVAGIDPVAFLEKVKHRVVSMHASDRYLAPGATIEDLKEAHGQTGYSDKLLHGVTGQGLNDYDAFFRILAEVNYSGWISVEDGMNGLGEIAESVEFLKAKRAQYFV